MEPRLSWSDLPEDLSTKIGQCLDARFDIIRFRSVCKKWRNSLPSSQRNLHLPLTLRKRPKYHNPIVNSDDQSSYDISSSLVSTTVYILNQYPIPSPISIPWLLKLEEIEQGKLLIINPISDKPVKDLPTSFPRVLNLLDYPVSEVSRGYMHKETFKRMCEGGERVTYVSTTVSKAVVLPESDRVGMDHDFMVLILRQYGGLLLGKNGDEYLTIIKEDKFHYDDIAVYRGHFVVTDRWGIVSFVDSSSSKLIQYTPPVLNGGQKKHLVVSSDHLYVVDRYFDRPRTSENPYCKEDAKVVGFKVYKLDEDWGWREITSLDDRILFIGESLNFFVPIKELSGCKGNYIYFVDEVHTWYNDEEDALIGSTAHGIAVFDFEDRRIGKLSSFPGGSDLLWPPPSWFSTTN